MKTIRLVLIMVMIGGTATVVSGEPVLIPFGPNTQGSVQQSSPMGADTPCGCLCCCGTSCGTWSFDAQGRLVCDACDS